MKTVYLHIGPHKTGTTTIQRALFDHTDMLERDHSVRFCRTGRVWPRQNINLAWQFLNPRFFKPGQGTWQDLRQEIAAGTAQAYVVSEELLSQCRPSDIQAIRTALDGFDVKIIFYGRSTVRWLESFYAQSFKNLLHPQLKDFPAFLQAAKAPYRDVGQILPVLDRWTAVFGRDNIHLRSMSQASTAPGGLARDFLSLLQVRLTDPFTPEKPANPRMGIQTLQLFTQIARHIQTSRIFLERHEVDEIRNLLGKFGTIQGWNDQPATFRTAESLQIIADIYLPPAQRAFEHYAPDQVFDTSLPAPDAESTASRDHDPNMALTFLRNKTRDRNLAGKLDGVLKSAPPDT